MAVKVMKRCSRDDDDAQGLGVREMKEGERVSRVIPRR